MDVLKIEVPRSRGVVSTASGKILRRRLKFDGSPEVIPMYSYEIPSRLAELGMLDYSAQPLAGAKLDDLERGLLYMEDPGRIIQSLQAEM